jgi:hypothetical protein
MGRMSFTQEMKVLAKAGERADARCCREAVLFLHHELGRTENALGRAVFTMRYGQRGEWRQVLRDAAAQTLREARWAASDYNRDRLRRAVGCYLRLAECEYREVAELMLRAEERAGGRRTNTRARREFVHVAAEVRWAGEPLPAKEGERAPPESRPGTRFGVDPRGFAGPSRSGASDADGPRITRARAATARALGTQEVNACDRCRCEKCTRSATSAGSSSTRRSCPMSWSSLRR